MKRIQYFIFALAISGLVACSTSDSPVLKQARTMQESLMKECNLLDSSVTSKVTVLEGTLIDMSKDTTLNSDTALKAKYVILKEQYNGLLDAKTRIDNWRINMKLLPTPEEIAKGAENPFGKDASDEDVLNAMRSANADFLTLKADLDKINQ
jgi:hypothetical protein